VASLDAETAQLIERMAGAESMLEAAEIELSAAQETKKSLSSQLEERRVSLGDDLSGISTPYILSLQNQLGEAVAERTKFICRRPSQNAGRISYEGQIKTYDEKSTRCARNLMTNQKIENFRHGEDALNYHRVITGLMRFKASKHDSQIGLGMSFLHMR
jgi:hypothetical protein